MNQLWKNAALIGALALPLTMNPAAAMDKKLDGEWTTFTGKVTSVSPNEFIVKSGEENILVEMDDYDWDADGYKLVIGDDVSVSGKVDEDLFEKRSIEAGAVYVKGLDAMFFASPMDEEGSPLMNTHVIMTDTLPEGASARIQGKVVDVEEDEFTVNTGLREVEVDTETLSFDPLDDKGFVKIKKGDRVRVAGVVDDDFLDGKKLNAKFLLDFN